MYWKRCQDKTFVNKKLTFQNEKCSRQKLTSNIVYINITFTDKGRPKDTRGVWFWHSLIILSFIDTDFYCYTRYADTFIIIIVFFLLVFFIWVYLFDWFITVHILMWIWLLRKQLSDITWYKILLFYFDQSFVSILINFNGSKLFYLDD